jgi:predicted GH43/DUF377 family glycosyl hydrolase
MKIEKKGLVFSPNKNIWWQQHYAILPTPFCLEERGIIRVFFSTTCSNKFGRLSYVDLDYSDPSKIINHSENFILDVGVDGAFDDCGVNPSSIIKILDEYYLYYAGYQRHEKTPYSIFSGLAISKDLDLFTRYNNVPILERSSIELSLRSAPSVIWLNDKYYMIYVSDYGWSEIGGNIFNGRKMPQYCLRSATSLNGIDWEPNTEPVIYSISEDEFGFGRPYLFVKGEIYYLFYSIRRKNQSYRIGYAISRDNCISWERRDDIRGLDVSQSGWDSEMICYAAPISVGNKSYVFYNGNNNGETGFGYAEIIEW